MPKQTLTFHVDRENIIFLSILGLFFLLAVEFLPAISLKGFFNNVNYSPIRFFIDIFSYLFGNFIIFILPGVVWRSIFSKTYKNFFEFIFYSFLTSLFILIISTTVYKIISHKTLDHLSFVMIIAFIILSGLIFLFFKRQRTALEFSLFKIEIHTCCILGVLIGCCIWFLQERILWAFFDNNFSSDYVLSLPLGTMDDLTEHFGMVDSLRNYLLPFWDLEYADRFGYTVIDPPLHKFISLFLVLFFEQTFAVQSLNTIIVLLISYIFVFNISGLYEVNKEQKIPLLIGGALFLSCFFMIVLGDDLAIVLCDHIHIMAFLVVVQLYALVQADYRLFLLSAAFAFFVKYEALVFTLLGLFFYINIFKVNKKIIGGLLLNYLLIIFPYIILMAGLGFFYGNLGVYAESFSVERFTRLDYFGIIEKFYPQSHLLWEEFSAFESLQFFMQFLISTAFLGIFLFFPQKDKMSQLFQGVALVYLVFIILSRVKRPHYVSPLTLLSIVVIVKTILQYNIFKFSKKGP